MLLFIDFEKVSGDDLLSRNEGGFPGWKQVSGTCSRHLFSSCSEALVILTTAARPKRGL